MNLQNKKEELTQSILSLESELKNMNEKLSRLDEFESELEHFKLYLSDLDEDLKDLAQLELFGNNKHETVKTEIQSQIIVDTSENDHHVADHEKEINEEKVEAFEIYKDEKFIVLSDQDFDLDFKKCKIFVQSQKKSDLKKFETDLMTLNSNLSYVKKIHSLSHISEMLLKKSKFGLILQLKKDNEFSILESEKFINQVKNVISEIFKDEKEIEQGDLIIHKGLKLKKSNDSVIILNPTDLNSFDQFMDYLDHRDQEFSLGANLEIFNKEITDVINLINDYFSLPVKEMMKISDNDEIDLVEETHISTIEITDQVVVVEDQENKFNYDHAKEKLFSLKDGDDLDLDTDDLVNMVDHLKNKNQITGQQFFEMLRSMNHFVIETVNTVYSAKLLISKLENYNSKDEINRYGMKVDFLEIVTKIDKQIARLNWTPKQAQDWLMINFGKKSRQLLSDDQLLECLEQLKIL